MRIDAIIRGRLISATRVRAAADPEGRGLSTSDYARLLRLLVAVRQHRKGMSIWSPISKIWGQGKWRKIIGIAAICACYLLTSKGFTMDFSLVNDKIYASGGIVSGDAAKLSQFVLDRNLTQGFDEYVVQFDSPGGSLIEGIEIGNIIRDARLETIVARGSQCASACALAFLGGTRRYATGEGPGRRLEVGASLVFLSFRYSADKIQVGNNTLSEARILSALTLEYASKVKSVDLGWLAKTQTVAPNDLHYVRTPADIAAFSISLIGIPSLIPRDWHLNVCRLVVNGMVPSLDHFPTRVQSHSEPIPSIKALRNVIVSGRYDAGSIATMAVKLSDSDAIDMALGGPFYLNMRKPILDARSVSLERGVGFYYDKCIVIRTEKDVSAMLIDEVSHIVSRNDFNEYTNIDFRLAMHDRNTPLW
jgi:hypothetical protein